MLNEDKIKLMTGISFFEKREGKHICPANRYFMRLHQQSDVTRILFVYLLLLPGGGDLDTLQHGVASRYGKPGSCDEACAQCLCVLCDRACWISGDCRSCREEPV